MLENDEFWRNQCNPFQHRKIPVVYHKEFCTDQENLSSFAQQCENRPQDEIGPLHLPYTVVYNVEAVPPVGKRSMEGQYARQVGQMYKQDSQRLVQILQWIHSYLKLKIKLYLSYLKSGLGKVYVLIHMNYKALTRNA